jgi:hypothetical protein
MTPRKYVPVLPREHSPECRRHLPDAPGFDLENCARCRALRERLRREYGARHVVVVDRP